MVNFFVGLTLNLVLGFLMGCLFCYIRHYHRELNTQIQMIKDGILSLSQKQDYIVEKINK